MKCLLIMLMCVFGECVEPNYVDCNSPDPNALCIGGEEKPIDLWERQFTACDREGDPITCQAIIIPEGSAWVYDPNTRELDITFAPSVADTYWWVFELSDPYESQRYTFYLRARDNTPPFFAAPLDWPR